MRKEFPAKIKFARWQHCGGHCENCGRKLFTGDIRYDHHIPDQLGGEPVFENCRVLCVDCHEVKTSMLDVPDIAKAKRRERAHAGIKRPRTITRWRRFDGSVVVAERER